MIFGNQLFIYLCSSKSSGRIHRNTIQMHWMKCIYYWRKCCFFGRASNQTTKLSICVTTFEDVYRKFERQIDFSVSLHLHPLAGIWIKFFTWEISVASSTLNRCSSRKCKGQTSYQITSSKTNRQTNFVFCEIGSFFGWWFTASHLSETYFWGRRFSQSLRWIFETN